MLKIDFFFQKFFFSIFSKKLKIVFLKNLIIFKKLFKYIKLIFLIKKVIFYQKNLKQTHHKLPSSICTCATHGYTASYRL